MMIINHHHHQTYHDDDDTHQSYDDDLKLMIKFMLMICRTVREQWGELHKFMSRVSFSTKLYRDFFRIMICIYDVNYYESGNFFLFLVLIIVNYYDCV